MMTTDMGNIANNAYWFTDTSRGGLFRVFA